MNPEDIKTVEDMDKYEKWIIEEFEKGNFVPVENFEEVNRVLIAAADGTFRKVREMIEKVLFDALKGLPEGKNLLLPTFEIEFKRKTGEPLSKYEKTFQDTVNELIEKKYVVFHGFRMGAFSRGVNFDEWEKKFSASENSPNISVQIQNSNAPVNVAGHTAVQNNNITPEELISALEKLLEDPKKGKSLLDKLKEGIETGTSALDLLNKIILYSKGLVI
jgi:hypothetical protein